MAAVWLILTILTVIVIGLIYIVEFQDEQLKALYEWRIQHMARHDYKSRRK